MCSAEVQRTTGREGVQQLGKKTILLFSVAQRSGVEIKRVEDSPEAGVACLERAERAIDARAVSRFMPGCM